MEKQDRVEEREPVRREVETGKQEGIEESKGEDYRIREPDNGTTHPVPSPTANAAVNPVPHEHTRFNWATDIDKSIGPVPTLSDFFPMKVLSPLASPEPTPHLVGNCIPAPQPVHTTPKCVVTPSRRNGPHTPVSPTKFPVPITAPPWVPTKCAPTVMAHGPCNLSMLRSDAPNPWGSLCRRHGGRHSHAPHQFSHQRQHPPTYPTNAYTCTTPTPKPPTPARIPIFETVRHPHRIGPNKPVIRVPARMEMATSTHPAPSDWAIVKSAPPLHPVAPVQCRCGQLVPLPGNQVSHSLPLHHTFSSFISQFISLSFPFPKQLFSSFTFS